MALSAIEIYNKPNFAAREQIFSILLVNAWEALFKAKLVKNAGGRLTVLYVKDGNRYKRTRSGQHFTIDVGRAMELCLVPEIVKENMRHLLEVRNAATHLSSSSESLPMLVFSLGSAALRNYARLLRDWFGIGLNDYNFYILPLGFSYPFKTLSAVDLQKEPEDIARIVAAVATSQDHEAEADGFFLVCELKTELVSAKKLTDGADLVGKIDQTATATFVTARATLIDQYQLTYKEALKKILAQLPGTKPHEVNAFIVEQKIKGDTRYSAYHYPNKSAMMKGPTKATAVIYNDNFIRFCVESLKS